MAEASQQRADLRAWIEANRDRIDALSKRVSSLEAGMSERFAGSESRLTRIQTLLEERLPERRQFRRRARRQCVREYMRIGTSAQGAAAPGIPSAALPCRLPVSGPAS